jgi:hypothetical protein
MGWPAQEYPGLVKSYEEMYADNAYGPKADRNALQQRVRGLVAAAGGLRPGAGARKRRWTSTGHPERGPNVRGRPTEQQLTLL